MEAEEEQKCLGFPAETAVLLTPTSNLQNPRIRNGQKLLFILISIHCTSIPSVQDRVVLNETYLISSQNINRYGLKIKCQTIVTIKLKVLRLSSAQKWKLSFNSTLKKRSRLISATISKWGAEIIKCMSRPSKSESGMQINSTEAIYYTIMMCLFQDLTQSPILASKLNQLSYHSACVERVKHVLRLKRQIHYYLHHLDSSNKERGTYFFASFSLQGPIMSIRYTEFSVWCQRLLLMLQHRYMLHYILMKMLEMVLVEPLKKMLLKLLIHNFLDLNKTPTSLIFGTTTMFILNLSGKFPLWVSKNLLMMRKKQFSFIWFWHLNEENHNWRQLEAKWINSSDHRCKHRQSLHIVATCYLYVWIPFRHQSKWS